MATKHLLINPACEPKDWLTLCGADGGEYTSQFNTATCNDCIELELAFVHETEEVA